MGVSPEQKEKDNNNKEKIWKIVVTDGVLQEIICQFEAEGLLIDRYRAELFLEALIEARLGFHQFLP